uniref:SH3 domain-containing protein n=1 Tax=Synechococcus sp. UW106 TaxID=368495 RepID=UPI000E0EF9E8|nr:SH3 domain-containing protein [Synechococcus sp. UW106]
MGGVLRWSWLLGVALMAPAALPAGGADRRQPQHRRREASGPLHTSTDQPLHLSPLEVAPRLRTLKAGSSLRLLRRWSAADGQDWLHVQTVSGEQRRGWLRA